MSLNKILNMIHTLILLQGWNHLIINICKKILISKATLVLLKILNLKMLVKEILKVKINNKILILMIYFRFDFKEDL